MISYDIISCDHVHTCYSITQFFYYPLLFEGVCLIWTKTESSMIVIDIFRSKGLSIHFPCLPLSLKWVYSELLVFFFLSWLFVVVLVCQYAMSICLFPICCLFVCFCFLFFGGWIPGPDRVQNYHNGENKGKRQHLKSSSFNLSWSKPQLFILMVLQCYYNTQYSEIIQCMEYNIQTKSCSAAACNLVIVHSAHHFVISDHVFYVSWHRVITDI